VRACRGQIGEGPRKTLIRCSLEPAAARATHRAQATTTRLRDEHVNLPLPVAARPTNTAPLWARPTCIRTCARNMQTCLYRWPCQLMPTHTYLTCTYMVSVCGLMKPCAAMRGGCELPRDAHLRLCSRTAHLTYRAMHNHALQQCTSPQNGTCKICPPRLTEPSVGECWRGVAPANGRAAAGHCCLPSKRTGTAATVPCPSVCAALGWLTGGARISVQLGALAV